MTAAPAGRQVGALLALRWQMLRSTGIRVALLLGTAFVAWLLVIVARGAGTVPDAQLATAVQLAPQVFLGFGLLAVVAPLTAGGGQDVVPASQLVAYPVRPRTLYLGGLVLAPVNLIWLLQVLALVAETAFLSYGGHALPAALTTVAYAGALGAWGQALAWWVIGLRQTRTGRRAVAVAGLVVVASVIGVVQLGLGRAALDRTPTRTVVAGVLAGAQGDGVRWAATTLPLLLAAALGVVVGARTCAWSVRQPADEGATRSGRAVPRRRDHGSALRTLVAVDRASVWRAPALKRGALVLTVLPGIAATVVSLPWHSVAVMPSLVAAGSGLLFGINAFSLDGSGALWLASLPHRPALALQAKAWVLTETVLGAVVVSGLTCSLRSPGSPTAADLLALGSSVLASTALCVASCLGLAVAHPHRAELNGPRDAVAPPGALVLASVRLSGPLALLGIALGGLTHGGRWWAPLLLAVPVCAGSALWLRHTLTRWTDPFVRARVMQVVAAG